MLYIAGQVSSGAATVMQKRILPGETRQVKLRATGSGVSIIEVCADLLCDFKPHCDL